MYIYTYTQHTYKDKVKLSVCLIISNTTKMYVGEGVVAPRIHIEKFGYSVNTCYVFRKSQVRIPARTLTSLNHFAASEISPCNCPVISSWMYIGLHLKYRLFLSDVIQHWRVLTQFLKIIEYQIQWQSVQWEPRCSMRMNRQITPDEANSHSSQILRTRLKISIKDFNTSKIKYASYWPVWF
jgi:hypothetical protein